MHGCMNVKLVFIEVFMILTLNYRKTLIVSWDRLSEESGCGLFYGTISVYAGWTEEIPARKLSHNSRWWGLKSSV